MYQLQNDHSIIDGIRLFSTGVEYENHLIFVQMSMLEIVLQAWGWQDYNGLVTKAGYSLTANHVLFVNASKLHHTENEIELMQAHERKKGEGKEM